VKRSSSSAGPDVRPRTLDPERLGDHLDQLYRAAWALCGSRHDAEDLVQETLLNVLKRPRLLRDGNEIGYLMRALRNTWASRYRTLAHRPVVHRLLEDDALAQEPSEITAREIMEAIASAPTPYRDAVIAVDVLGLSYREAARSLRTREATVTSRLHRGRQHVARRIAGEPDGQSGTRPGRAVTRPPSDLLAMTAASAVREWTPSLS
jgi:RNA polymerase sigma-70 factor, ECF subfamily